MVENCIYEFFKASFLELNTLNFQRAFGEVNKNEGLPNFQNANVKYDEEGIIANEATQENNESEIEEIINNNNNMNNYSTDNEIIITNQNNEENDLEYLDKKPIFSIKKQKKLQYSNCYKRRRWHPNIEGCYIPKERHLNVEKKKNRIQFQKNHIKTIYSYISLTPPYDFKELFQLVRDHQEKHNFQDKRSFHFIRDKYGQVKIVTFQEKQVLLQKARNKIKEEVLLNFYNCI